MNIRTFVAFSSRNLQYDFPKMRGGVKGRLEFFLKFIRFGSQTLPSVSRPYMKMQTKRNTYFLLNRKLVENWLFGPLSHRKGNKCKKNE